jgi:hypothetical protein
MTIRAAGGNQIEGAYSLMIQGKLYTSCFTATVSADGTVADGVYYQAAHGKGLLTFKITTAPGHRPTFAGIYSWTKPGKGAPPDEAHGYSGYWAGAKADVPPVQPDPTCTNNLKSNN